MMLEYLYQKIRILKAYLDGDFDEVRRIGAEMSNNQSYGLTLLWPALQHSIRNNFTLLYELLDGMCDAHLLCNLIRAISVTTNVA
jgi:hypothetical protein